jgi:hypothetical protein
MVTHVKAKVVKYLELTHECDLLHNRILVINNNMILMVL